MPRYNDHVELDEMLRRLDKMKTKFPPDDAGKGGGVGKEDDFSDLEDSFLRRIANVQEMIKNIGTGSDTKSITDQIRQKRNIHNEIQGISDIMMRMKEMLEKEKSRKRKKVSDEEMQRRETNFQSFAALLKKVQDGLRREKAKFGEIDGIAKTTLTKDDLFSGNSGGLAGMVARGAGVGMSSAGDATRGGGGGGAGGLGGLSAAQQQTLIEIQQRDQEQDLIIEEIGKLIEEAGQIAKSIHETVDTQSKMFDGLEQGLERTQDDLTGVNAKLKKTLKAKGMSWERMCVLFFCLVFVLGIVGVIVAGL